MSCLDHWRPIEKCAFNQSTWLMRDPPALIEPEKVYQHSLERYPQTPLPSEAMSSRQIVPHENDVLMGRGGKNNQHIGNEKLRAMARTECDSYRLASKKGKSYISRELVKKVREMVPPGRFLKRNQKTGGWEDVGDEIGREKASQVLRDAVSATCQTPGDITKNVSESLESSDHEEQQQQHQKGPVVGRKRQRPESAASAEWPAPPRSFAAVGADNTYIEPHTESFPVTPVAASRPKRQREDDYHQEEYLPSPSTSPYRRNPPTSVDHSHPAQQPLPPSPPYLPHYQYPIHHNDQYSSHRMPYPPYEYSASMPPPSYRSDYPPAGIPYRPQPASYAPPPLRGVYPTWAGNGGYVEPALHRAPTARAPDVNEFDFLHEDFFESDDEGRHPDIHRNESF